MQITTDFRFSGAIPRQAFNMLLANLNRLPTKVRLASWGLNVQTTCCLCNSYEESRDHLFLTCTYAITLWRLIFARLDRHQALPITWSELLSWTRLPLLHHLQHRRSSPLNHCSTTFGDSTPQLCISDSPQPIRRWSSSTGTSATPFVREDIWCSRSFIT